jgi:threonine dehydratase
VQIHDVLPTPDEVRAAAARIAGTVKRTSLMHSPALSTSIGGDAFLKLECDQPGGSFKLRGALNAMLSLSPDARERGVVASSAGNHGLGVAIAAERLGIDAMVFVPASAPEVKRDGISARGARVDATRPNYDEAERAARHYADETGATFLSPCSGRALLAGAGTVALEILTDLPNVGSIVAAVGGGGLTGGMGGFLRGAAPGVRLLGAQSERTNAMSLALASGQPTDIPDLPTLCDGLAGLVDAEMLAQGQRSLDAIATVDEGAVADAIRWLHREHRIRAEGSGAVAVAALLTRAIVPKTFPIAVVISGGNIDEAKHSALLQHPASESR